MIHPRAPTAVPALLSLVPPALLARLLEMLVRSMRRRHPALVAAFARLDPAVVHVVLTDPERRFSIRFGQGRMEITLVLMADPPPPDAIIRGDVGTLIELLEGRIDGDTLFFNRGIEITGSTAVIVAMRNTLDREDIDIRDEIAALFGVLERPARSFARRLGRVASRMHTRLATIHARLHDSETPSAHRNAEVDELRAEVKKLSAKLAKLDVRQLRHDTLAAR